MFYAAMLIYKNYVKCVDVVFYVFVFNAKVFNKVWSEQN